MQANLRHFWQAWQRVGQWIGDSIARLFLTFFYFTVLVPFALVARLLGDPLQRDSQARSTRWLERKTGDRTIYDARRQF